MSFLHPEFIYYMLPPMLILFLFLLTQKETQATFFSEEVMEKLRVGSSSMSLKVRNIFFMLMSALLIIALSEPVIDDGKVEVKSKSADIMIALDISDSMLAEDVYPNRLKLAKQKAIELLTLSPTERIGVIGFAKNSYLVSPLSFDHSVVKFLLSQLNTDSITEKGTNFLSMLEVVQNSIDEEAKKYLLILSDGGDNDEFSKEIAYAKENNIAVFVLGIGTKNGAPIKKKDGQFIKQNGNIIVSKLNENISEMATATGGVYIKSVNSNDDVKAMIKEIEAHSEQKELKSQEIARYIPLFYYPLGMALFILLIATSSLPKKSSNIHALLLALIFIAPQSKLNAGLLDFMELKDAKEAYANEEYEKSQGIYSKYMESSAYGNYNVGNTLYKQGKFQEARESYEKANFDDESLRAKNYSNIGNTYAKEPRMENLKKAVESYESSLKLEDDKDTRENLEAVKKVIEEQEKQEQENKDDKNKKENSDKKDEESKSDKSDKKDEESKENKEGDSKESEDKKEKSEKSEEEKKSKEQEEKQKSEQEKKKDEAKELEDNNATQSQAEQQQVMKHEMSDEEQMKWLNQLNKEQNTYLYMLNPESRAEENENDKPW